jgi:xylonate dehydratase
MTMSADACDILREHFEPRDPSVLDIATRAPGPAGSLPLTPEFLRDRPSGDLFGWTMNAGMGWDPADLGKPEVIILSTSGGLRGPGGRPLALGLHVGHWELELLAREAAAEIRALGQVPFAASVTDPCDGRTQGTPGMMDSLAYRNDAAIVLRRLIRSLPTRKSVLGIAGCDKGLPAMMMALAGMKDLPSVIVPGGVTLPPEEGEDAGKAQSLGARFAHGAVTLEDASVLACRACASPGGGCQFLGTAATSQVVAEALGMALPHSALAPSGQPVWLDLARRSARALAALSARGTALAEILTSSAIRNAMAVHAAFGGSTNLLIHLPAIAHAVGLPRPTVDDWLKINRRVPRLVDAIPNGPHPTVRVFLAGGVPEVLLHLRRAGLVDCTAGTAVGAPLDAVLDAWERSPRRCRLRDRLREADGIDPEDVILSPESSRARGFSGTLAFVRGNLAPEGAVVKATAIDPSVIGPGGIYLHTGPARVFTEERTAVRAIKSRGDDRVRPGDVIVLICRGPLGAGMEEIFQVTSALRHLEFGKRVAVLTDARFSGVSTGACIGHVSPEALAGGPLGKMREGDLVRIEIDRGRVEGRADLVGEAGGPALGPEAGAAILAARPPRPDLAPDPLLPADTRLWAALQARTGGPWGGCVYEDRL